MKTKTITQLTLAGTLMAPACHQGERVVEKPNILWIVADDLGMDLRCYGEEAVHTPNLDQFAAQGERYTNMYTVTAVSSPSRSALITGMYPTSTGCHQHRTRYKDSLPDPVRPITHLFREAGYFTSNGNFQNMEKPGKQDYNFLADSLYDGTDWTQRDAGQPFFAQVQVFWPHRPFKRDTANPVDPGKLTIPPYYPDHPVTRHDWAWYLEFIQLMDKEVGKVLERLDQEGLTENTVVFFFGDQGRPHVRAKQFMYDGGINTPLIVRWPGKIKAGKVNDQMVSNIDIAAASLQIAGIPVPDYMQGRDFLSKNSPGREYIYAMRDRRDETVDRIRAVRSRQFKYIRNFYPERPYTQFNAYKKQAYPVLTLMQELKKQGRLNDAQLHFMANERPPEELYDVINDPYEINNLADNKEYKEELEKYRELLDEWIKKADLGTYPEEPEEIEYAKELMEERYKERMREKGLGENPTDQEILDYWKTKFGLE